MDLKKTFIADREKVDNGVPVKINDATFYLTFFGADVAQLALTNKARKYGATMNEDHAGVAAMKDVLVDYIVKGWENLTEDGQEVEYSKETLRRLFNDYPGFAETLMTKANNVFLFKRQSDEKLEQD